MLSRGLRSGGVWGLGLICAAGWIAFAAVCPARAEDPPQYEIAGGGEIAGHTWSAYTSTTIALSALGIGAPKSIQEDGWRLRAGGGYWQYARRQEEWVPGVGSQQVSRKRTGSFADLLLGYHATVGDLTLKAYAGGIYERQQWSANPIDDSGSSSDLAAKLLVESWLNLTPDAFAQLDVGWVSQDDAVNARARFGYRVIPSISIGPEIAYWAAARDQMPGRDELVRYGGFARYEWTGGEVSLSAGAMDSEGDQRFYATVNALLRF